MAQGNFGARTVGAAIMSAAILAVTVGSTAPAAAFPRRGGFYHHHHRGLGVGAAVGLGIGAAALGAVAAGAAANNYYNGYPVYSGGVHPGYGYDYYPEHGYYGPY